MSLSRNVSAFLLLLFLFFFFGLPLYTVLRQGLEPQILLEVFRNRLYLEGMTNSLALALTTTFLVLLIAIPLAWLYNRFEFKGKNAVNLMIMLPMILPPFVGALGFQKVLGHYGLFNTVLAYFGASPVDWLGGTGRFWAVCGIEALHLYPILYLNLAAALANIDPAMEEAAANLGAGTWTRFRKITLPLMRPGLFAGGSIVLIWSFTELGTPLMLGYNRVATVQIFNGITELETNPLPYALVVVMLAFSAGLYILSRLCFGGERVSGGMKGSSGAATQKLHGISSCLPITAFLSVTIIAILPHLSLVLTALSFDWNNTILPTRWTLQHFRNALSDNSVLPSIVNSLKYSVTAMILCVILGMITALLSVRWKIRGRQFFDVAAMLPLAVPGIILAFGYLSMANRYDWAAVLLNPAKNPTLLLIIAYAMRRLPYTTRAIAAGLEQTPPELEEAARNLGAGPLRTLLKITTPLIAANILVGALFAFSFSMLEVSDSLILAQKTEFYPITRALFELTRILGSGSYIACAFGVWAMCFLACTITAAGIILGKKLGMLFRF